MRTSYGDLLAAGGGVSFCDSLSGGPSSVPRSRENESCMGKNLTDFFSEDRSHGVSFPTWGDTDVPSKKGNSAVEPVMFVIRKD